MTVSKPEFTCHMDNECYEDCLESYRIQMKEYGSQLILTNDLKLTEEQKGVMV